MDDTSFYFSNGSGAPRGRREQKDDDDDDDDDTFPPSLSRLLY